MDNVHGQPYKCECWSGALHHLPADDLQVELEPPQLKCLQTAQPYSGQPTTIASMSSPVKLRIQFNCCVFLMFKAVLCVDLKYAVNKLGMKGSS